MGYRRQSPPGRRAGVSWSTDFARLWLRSASPASRLSAPTRMASSIWRALRPQPRSPEPLMVPRDREPRRGRVHRISRRGDQDWLAEGRGQERGARSCFAGPAWESEHPRPKRHLAWPALPHVALALALAAHPDRPGVRLPGSFAARAGVRAAGRAHVRHPDPYRDLRRGRHARRPGRGRPAGSASTSLAALEAARLCSNDPVCAEHDPSAEHDPLRLHGAACHGCLLIAETSCEQRNDWLDRALVVPTVATPDAALFV